METVDLELPAGLHQRLTAYAAASERPLDALAEAIIEDAIEPPAPAIRLAMLRCGRCGVVKHRWSRARATGRGTYAMLYGCTKCYRLRLHGAVEIRGWEALRPRPEPLAPPELAPALAPAPPALLHRCVEPAPQHAAP